MLARERSREEWRDLLAGAVTDPLRLLARLELSAHPISRRIVAAPAFPIRVPEPYLACMTPGDPDDPLLRQVLAVADEERTVAGFATDPLAENGANPVPGLLHKYRGRALLIAAGGCAIHCRYCFRRHFPYADNNPGRRGLESALDYLRSHADIHEVILSGGDPLLLDDDALDWLLARLAGISHLRRLRIHSRLPVVIPQRLTPRLLDLLTGSRLRSVLVLHMNHPRELQTGLREVLEPLRRTDVPILNQAVLLAGVNDCVDTLVTLCEQGFDAGILPYYLHLLDRVAGTAHFEVEEERARKLYDALAAELPGYLLPRLVRERPGDPGKLPLAPRFQ